YGVAAADTDPPVYTWEVVYNNEGSITVDNARFETGSGKNMRAVLSTGSSTVTLGNVTVATDAGSSWGAHGVGANGDRATVSLIGGTIDSKGQYSNGIQAENGGTV